MVILFLILVVAASAALGFIVLIQNPKGGGLAGNVGGVGNNFMGVKQTTDVLEKGTWIFAGTIALLAILSTLFFKNIGGGVDKKAIETIPTTNTTAPAPTPQAPANTVPATK
jgi:preprotein translocase subunit SecG